MKNSFYMYNNNSICFLLVTIPNISYADYGIDPSSYDPEIQEKLMLNLLEVLLEKFIIYYFKFQ